MVWQTELSAIKQAGLHRELSPSIARMPGRVLWEDQWVWDFSSNDYLGLATDSKLMDTYKNTVSMSMGMGATGSRLLSGDNVLVHELEEELAATFGYDAGLCFNSGYHANIGLMSALFRKGDVVFVDKKVHASIIDGLLLSKAVFFRFKHQDLAHLKRLLTRHRPKYNRACIVSEGVFSMDGDCCDVRGLGQLKQEFDTLLMIDEAHSIGIFGPKGLGVVAEEGGPKRCDILVGTFGKSIGGQGAFVLGSHMMREMLIQSARPFIYSTALSPILLQWNRLAFRRMLELDVARQLYWKRIKKFCKKITTIEELKRPLPSPIVPIIMGTNKRAIQLADFLQMHGFFTRAVRYPTVPKGSSRVRLSLSMAHPDDVLDQLAQAILEGYHVA